MLRLSPRHSQSSYIVKGDLEDLLRRLKPGMRLGGRIVDCLGEGLYLLRIRGYNILTESEQLFQQFDEVQLVVREVEPHLVLDLSSGQQSRDECVNEHGSQTNILVF